MTNLDRRNLIKGSACLAALGLTRSVARAGAPTIAIQFFRPGEPWLDTQGKPIYCAGSSIIKVDETYYWYGENKEHTTGNDKIWHWGMRMYSSHDLYNWTDLGNFIEPVLSDRASPLHPEQFVDRPHILYCERTGKFVCWIKLLSDPFQTRAVLVSDKITGPYSLVKKEIRPLGMSAGDYDLFTSPDDGKAYMAFERVHTEMIIADLTDDYTAFTGYYTTHLPRPGPPTTREGLSYFRRGSKHYMISSGTTGYFPNPSEVAVADTFHGPWTTMGNLCDGDASETTFNAQVSAVFKHPGKRDLYIAIADRWMGPLQGPDFTNGERSRLVRHAFESQFTRHATTAEDKEILKLWGGLRVNTSLARHVWLPLRWDGDRPHIEWRDQWSLDEFA